MGTPNREPQEYSRYIIGIYLPEALYSIIFLLFSWASLFGVPSRVPLLRLVKEGLAGKRYGLGIKGLGFRVLGFRVLGLPRKPSYP